jgi:hypothetical protein
MAHLELSGSFLITIGHGAGPETLLELAANRDDGSPFDLASLDRDAVRFFVALSAMFGSFRIDLNIVNVTHQAPGFAAYELKVPSDLGATLDGIHPGTIAVVVDDGTDRGQTLACGCAGATVSTWFGEEVKSDPR